jgi:ubiquinone/menaquinone biosynthesis C-methylase UbiE
MIDNNINNPKSPKYYIKRYLDRIQKDLKNSIVVDIPAGNGVTSEILTELGARVEAFDLFPEYFMLKDIQCQRANVMEEIPLGDKSADMVICQEGIEHFSDQLKAFKEFNRILKHGGKLLITTPSYSNLSAKLSYLLFESETHHYMPPNEINDIWMSDKSITNEVYHGHLFVLGLQKLRVLGKLAGFKIKEIKYLRLSKGSLYLFPVFYPFILITSLIRYYKWLRINKSIPIEVKKDVYAEQLKINISPKNLLNRHTFIIFEKEKHFDEVDFRMESMVKQFDKIM